MISILGRTFECVSGVSHVNRNRSVMQPCRNKLSSYSVPSSMLLSEICSATSLLVACLAVGWSFLFFYLKESKIVKYSKHRMLCCISGYISGFFFNNDDIRNHVKWILLSNEKVVSLRIEFE